MIECENCFGTGEEPDTYNISKKDPITKCHVCKGSGQVENDNRPDHIGTNFTPDFNSMEYKKHYR